jgi:hypothetical protein
MVGRGGVVVVGAGREGSRTMEEESLLVGLEIVFQIANLRALHKLVFAFLILRIIYYK